MSDAPQPAPAPSPAPAPAPAPQASAPAPAPWYQGKVEDGAVEFWQSKKYDISDPVKLVDSLTRSYRGAEKLIGVPQDELIRVPKPNADTSDVKAYWGRIGVPAEGKEYDLAELKYTDGSVPEQGYTDTLRSLMHGAKVPKQYAADLVKGLMKYEEAQETAERAEKTAYTQRETESLDRSWGANKQANLVVAKAALDRLGQAAGLTPEQVQKGWDALSTVGGIGSAAAMEMLRVAGSRMGEDRFVSGSPGTPGSGPMTREQAKAEINALKDDKEFGRRLLAGGHEEKRKWYDLHRVAFAQVA